MSLKTSKGIAGIPEGAIRITKEEALEHQKNLIRKWPHLNDVLFLKYGHFMASALSGGSSFLILNSLRGIFKTPWKYMPFMIGSTVGVPIVASSIIVSQVITEPILLMSKKCPMCSQIKFTLFHGVLSLGYPTVYGFMALNSLALARGTFNLPSLKTNYKEFCKEGFKILKRVSIPLQVSAIIQAIFVMSLPMMQENELYNIMNDSKKVHSLEQMEGNAVLQD